ncbi:MAG: alpha-2-macroglobulin, partial [Comamonadaceae bacterium]
MGLAAPLAHALQITTFSPQGEVSRVRQVVANFDQSAVTFGDPKAPAPLTVACGDAQAAKGTGRWVNEKRWVYDFAGDLPPGVRCTATRIAGFKSPAGSELGGPANYVFNTGGPFVRRMIPGGGTIDEQQVFLLEFNGPVAEPTLLANTWCTAAGIGERIPVQALAPPQRTEFLKAIGEDRAVAARPANYAVLRCNRTLPPSAKVQLVYGKGVATPSGIENRIERRFDFEVRAPFAVTFSCERENAQSACLPLRPMALSFNAPVARALAAKIVLRGGGKTIAPKFDQEGEAAPESVVESVSFPAPFAERTAFTVELPAGFKDASDRPLQSPGTFPLKVSTAAMPPLAKFAAAPFGVVERLAEPGGVALMPVTVRNVEPALRVQALSPGKVSDLQPRDDADIIAWFRRVRRYENSYTLDRAEAARDVKGPLPPVIDADDKTQVQTRMLSLLGGRSGVKTLDMPKAAEGDPRPFEVVGIPLTPGFHVLEIDSRRLGESLLDARYGGGRTMYVRTSVLATNLAVHFKLGREGSVAWVTTLDKGSVVAGARVRVSGCDGR